ncbi:Tripartite motif-containing protein 66 [Bagarius yarrelli]|uniref:Tripartite motif-containing protein 66 n=1 Tax=Bagarius yarrelli TaxID=175774 RepID=A0A556VXH5_BAGYA|nr:Tripartite motif-containing protein 66 [Bagarius yarrelli]
MCPLHKQELLELFCETCDLLACSICHLSSHKDHRLVHVGKALQDQRWLLENLMARVEEKRSAVENSAKQIQSRLHSVKITQRKAENQIKMAKMIMMNELNKRANLLIEQLESISSGFKQHLEDSLQGAIELCSQLEHVQNFITWAAAHHRRNPLLFSKELIALQMQQLLEPLIHSETWTPLKIKFNWDASFWTKQISTLGQLSVEGGSRSYSEGVARSGILRPQPVPCVSLPSLCYPVRETDCSYPSFCQHQLCCLHCRPVPSVPLEKFPLSLDKYSVPHVPEPGCSSPPNLQRCWSSDATAQTHPSLNSTQAEPVQRSPDTVAVKRSTVSDQEPQSSREGPSEERLGDPWDLEPSEDRADILSEQTDNDKQRTPGRTPGRTPTPSDMLPQVTRCDVKDAENPESRTTACSVSAEPGPSSSTSNESCPQSEEAADEPQDVMLDCASAPESIPDDLMIRLHPGSCDGSSQTIYKSEPVSLCLKSSQLMSAVLLKEEPAEELARGVMYQPPSELTLEEHLPCNASPAESEDSSQELCNREQEFLATMTAAAHSSHLEPSTSPLSQSEHTSDPNPSEPTSVPASDSQLGSTADTDFGSDAELQAESEPSLTPEPQIELDSELELESEQVPELSAESESESESEQDSDPTSTAEVTLNLERECEWEAAPVAADVRVQEAVGVAEPECVEVESEDFCAVCSIGGELLCCDRCPKVFHLTCHVPSLLSFPTGDWLCTLCRDVQQPEVEYDCEDSRLPPHATPTALTPCDLRKCEKLTLLIYSNILSAPFHEPVSPLIIKRPMDLSVIRSRLNRRSSTHYSSVTEFVADVLLMFKNCAKFNYPDSEVAQAGCSLQNFFLSQLSGIFPEFSCSVPDGESDSDDYEEAECPAAVSFSWPERREQSHRKRKRRRSLSWRRHHY